MRIGIDCLRIDPAYVGGVNTFTLGLLGGFAAVGNGHRFNLFVTDENQGLFSRFERQPGFKLVTTSGRGLRARKRICQAALLSRSSELYRVTSNLAYGEIQAAMDAGCDIMYTPTVVLQSFSSRRPTVLSMHDIQHVHYPEFFSWDKRLSRTITYGLSARYAHCLQASSEFIKKDVLTHMSPKRVEIIPEGVTIGDFTEQQDISPLRERYSLPKRFLFCPAQLWLHKNHLTVLEALKEIEKREGLRIPLVMTGASFSAAPGILKFISEQNMSYVRYLGKVPFEDMVALYQGCDFLISASLYESSSLPILEAAAAGAPIIASRIPSHEELGQRLQINLFSARSVPDLVRVLLSLWDDRATASAQAAHNREKVAFYSWANVARQYLSLFDQIVAA
jgi:glycosyltransferase involved in cell wall biosynthesis